MEKTPSEDLNDWNLKYYIPGHVKHEISKSGTWPADLLIM